MLHPEEAWPRRRVQRKWILIVVALAIVLAGAVTAVALVMSGSNGDVGPAAAPEPAALLAPESFVAEREGLFGVRLAWAAPAGGVDVEHYDIYRNGSKLISLSDVGTTYVDDSVRPGKQYVYEIVSRSKAKTSERASATVTVSVPPLRSARVEGDFSVSAKTVSESGYGEYGPESFGWLLTPKCGEGACQVLWKDLHEKQIKTVLKRDGTRYRGTYSGFFFIECGGTHANSTVTIDLKVTKAAAVEGEWLATKLAGTVRQSESPQLGCGSSSATLQVGAKLVR